jgi:hypothetical protein
MVDSRLRELEQEFTEILISQGEVKSSVEWELLQVALICTNYQIKLEQSRLAVRLKPVHS